MLAKRNLLGNSLLDNMFSLSRELNNIFDSNIDKSERFLSPLTNVSEDEANYYVNIEIPGVNKEDIKVNVTSNSISIEGEIKQEKEDKKKTFHRVERYYGNFKRSFAFDEKIDESKIEAEYKNGVLNIKIPKSPEVKPKSITIK